MRGRRRGTVLVGAAAMLAGAAMAAGAQMHKVAKPEKVVRAVGVYEWTGDLGKPTASRFVPVSLFIDGALEDAGVYLPHPVPFALENGTEYELDAAGLPKGDLALETAAKVQTPEDAYTDGWIGYGAYRAPAPVAVAKATAPGDRGSGRVSGSLKVADTDDSKPSFSSRSEDATKGKGSSGREASGSAGSGSGSGSGAGSGTGADAGDRPTLQRRTDTGASEDAGSNGNGSDTSTDDPADRPTLKRRTPATADTKKQEKDDRKRKQQASVTGVGSLNDDPDRPTLHRGGSGGSENEEIPKLMGVPADLHQMVAVSDAARRDPHPFARPWGGDDERTAVLGTMRAMAAVEVAAYAKKAGVAASAGAGRASGAGATGTGAATGVGTVPRLRPGAGSGVKSRRTGPAAATPVLLDEEVRGFLLSYGGAPTYVYTAHTAGTGDGLRYVTVVAQVAGGGEVQKAMASVTDAGHLDRTPWLRLVDAVDVEASNRASLLFELRGKDSRQFALYRVLGARADQTFVTGTTQ